MYRLKFRLAKGGKISKWSSFKKLYECQTKYVESITDYIILPLIWIIKLNKIYSFCLILIMPLNFLHSKWICKICLKDCKMNTFCQQYFLELLIIQLGCANIMNVYMRCSFVGQMLAINYNYVTYLLHYMRYSLQIAKGKIV